MENPIHQMLADAVARGVNVTIITNDYLVPTLTLPWVFRETNMDATGKFRGAGYDLYVQDCDGDMSHWVLRREKVVIEKGESWDGSPFYHFDACLLAAEAALRAEVKRRKEEITRKRATLT
jgi:hypothetical protein